MTHFVESKLEIRPVHYPGYGSPPSWSIFVEYDNRLLETLHDVGGEREVGRLQLTLKTKWTNRLRAVTRGHGLDTYLKRRTLAHPLCYHCGQPCRYTMSSVGEHQYCEKTDCQAQIPIYQQQLRDDREAYEANLEAQRKRDDERRVAEARLVCQAGIPVVDSLPWGGGKWYAMRRTDGAVQFTQVTRNDCITDRLVISPQDWNLLVRELGDL